MDKFLFLNEKVQIPKRYPNKHILEYSFDVFRDKIRVVKVSFEIKKEKIESLLPRLALNRDEGKEFLLDGEIQGIASSPKGNMKIALLECAGKLEAYLAAKSIGYDLEDIELENKILYSWCSEVFESLSDQTRDVLGRISPLIHTI